MSETQDPGEPSTWLQPCEHCARPRPRGAQGPDEDAGPTVRSMGPHWPLVLGGLSFGAYFFSGCRHGAALSTEGPLAPYYAPLGALLLLVTFAGGWVSGRTRRNAWAAPVALATPALMYGGLGQWPLQAPLAAQRMTLLLWTALGCGYCLASLYEGVKDRKKGKPPQMLAWDRDRAAGEMLAMLGLGGAVFAFSSFGPGSEGGKLRVGVPFLLIGFFIAYTNRFRGSYVAIAFGVMCAIGVILVATTGDGTVFIGIFCALLLLPLALPAVLLGACIGIVQDELPHSNTRMLSLALLIITAGAAADELEGPREGKARVEATALLQGSPQALWDTPLFRGESAPEADLAEQLGLTTPHAAQGTLHAVGARQRIRYRDGHLLLEITHCEPPHRLDFAVIEQQGVEDKAARFLGGSLILKPQAEDSTQVTMSIRYRPRLRPAAYWRPMEAWVARSALQQVFARWQIAHRTSKSP